MGGSERFLGVHNAEVAPRSLALWRRRPGLRPVVSCDPGAQEDGGGEGRDSLRGLGPEWTAGGMEATLEQHLEDT